MWHVIAQSGLASAGVDFSGSLSQQKEEGIKKTFTKEKIEEVVGVIFITVALFLTGGFYYLLYQTLRNYEVF